MANAEIIKEFKSYSFTTPWFKDEWVKRVEDDRKLYNGIVGGFTLSGLPIKCPKPKFSL